jgi:hypothetical protein
VNAHTVFQTKSLALQAISNFTTRHLTVVS